MKKLDIKSKNNIESGLTLVIILFFYFNMVFAQQGNYRFNNYGNRSILLAGNVTGSVSDLGLTYYNPSFLANTETLGFSLNAQAYQLVKFKLNSVLNEASKLSSTKFNGASTMAGGIFNLFGTKFAYSYLTKSNYNYDLNYDSFYLNDDILSLFPNAIRHKAKIGLNSDIRDDWTGLTWAHKINDKLSVGISAFASIYNYKGRSDLNHAVESTNDEVASYQSIVSFKQKSYGLFFKLGANYQFGIFDLGLNINLPYLEFYDKGGFYYSEVISGVSPQYNTFIDYNFTNLSSRRKEPLGVSIGAGIPLKKAKLHLNFDFVSGINRYGRIEIPGIDIGDDDLTYVNFEEQRKTVFNFGLGAEYLISEKLKAYGGFSTDFNAFENSANIFDLSSKNNKDINIGEDFYHVSLGADWQLNWISLVMGVTYTGGSSKFVSPYQINANGFDIENNLNSQIKYTRWQFVVGVDVNILGKKMKELIIKENQD